MVMLSELVELRPAEEPLPQLSHREREILQLVAQGLTNRAIAGRLCVSERTVESHVSRTLLKLDIPESADHHRRVLAVLAFLGI
jgi:DNA-binding NarL/FixJ family response regulator